MKLSILIPAYNEERGIYNTLQQVKQAVEKQDLDDHEIIMIDDGSTDNTAEEAKKCEGAYIIQNERNLGYGASLKKGIRQARFNYILISDADGTYPLDKLNIMIQEIKSNDMVVGERKLKLLKYSILRRFAKILLRNLVYFITGLKIKDLNSGLRIFRKSAVQQFFPIIGDGFSFTTTISLALLQNGYRIKFIPIDYNARKGRSKIRPLKDTMSIIILIITTVMYFNPIKVLLPFAGLAFLGMIISLIFDIFVLHNITEKSLILLALGMAFFFGGIFADLLDKKFNVLFLKINDLNRNNKS